VLLFIDVLIVATVTFCILLRELALLIILQSTGQYDRNTEPEVSEQGR